MNIQHVSPVKSELVPVLLERHELDAAIGALIALDLSRGIEHVSISSALATLRNQLKKYDEQAA